MKIKGVIIYSTKVQLLSCHVTLLIYQSLTHFETVVKVVTFICQAWVCQSSYESFATVGEIRVWWRADFQSGSRVLKKVF